MRKIFLTVLFLSVVAAPAFCYSTCETRVDSHQNATTPQRVAYCLTEEDIRQAQAQEPELIYYGVTSKEPQPQEPVNPSKNKNPYFEEDKVQVTQGYVSTNRFPEFKNDILSEQERLAQQQAILAAQQKAAPDYHLTGEKPAKVQVAAQTVLTTETPAGLKKRQNKPARRMQQLQQTVVEETLPLEQPADTLPADTAMDEKLTQDMPADPLTPTNQPEVADLQSPYDMPYTDENNIPYGAN